MFNLCVCDNSNRIFMFIAVIDSVFLFIPDILFSRKKFSILLSWFIGEKNVKQVFKKDCLARKTTFGKISAQPHTIVKQICFPNGNVLF